MDSPRTRMYTHPFFEATPPGAAPGPPVKNRVPVFATSGGVIKCAKPAPTDRSRKVMDREQSHAHSACQGLRWHEVRLHEV